MVLIESDWNLKFAQLNKDMGEDIVLIESDWNLKTSITPFFNVASGVLIESDWNLKCIQHHLLQLQMQY